MKRTAQERFGANVHVPGGAMVVRLTEAEYGSLDTGKLARLRRLLLELAEQPAPPHLVVDLSQVHFFGARFIGVLLDTWDQLQKHSRRLALCGLTPYCAKVIRTPHLDKLFDTYPTQWAALEKIAQHVHGGDQEPPSTHVRVQVSDVSWDANMVRLEYVGDDDVPIRSVIVPRREADQTPLL